MSGSPEHDHDGTDRRARTRRRQRQFGFHLAGYFVVMVVLVPLNFMIDRSNPWFLFPMVAWGAPLAIHAAFVMGLLDGMIGRK